MVFWKLYNNLYFYWVQHSNSFFKTFAITDQSESFYEVLCKTITSRFHDLCVGGNVILRKISLVLLVFHGEISKKKVKFL